MAKGQKADQEEQMSLKPAKVKKLIIKNFRCIGKTPVEIDLDDIVVLVGANNAGKSTILRAYEVVMNQGSNDGKLSLDDFPGGKVDENNLPEIELQTYIDPKTAHGPGKRWIHIDQETGKPFVWERWIWSAPAPRDSKHEGYEKDWLDEGPWGAANVAKPHRPMAHRVDAFSSPEEQSEKVVGIIKSILQEQAGKPIGDGEESTSALDIVRKHLIDAHTNVLENSKAEIEKIEEQLTDIISEVFAGFEVKINHRHQDISEKALSLFIPELRMGLAGGHFTPIEKQGSGARRTLLWSALRLVGERGVTKKSTTKSKQKATLEFGETASKPHKSHVLLIDEPEICLHPNAVRETCRVLYDLAKSNMGWQVMVTTHSPAFIDLSRDNTTIVHVGRDEIGNIKGTTVFMTDRVKLDADDKANMKLLNIWDPYVGEFFFGGRSIIVEGDTEYSAFQYVISQEREKFRDVHIIRARGKSIIPPLMKILNQFGAPYVVLHDSDKPERQDKKRNSAWATNSTIISLAPNPKTVRVVASLPNFEEAFLGTQSNSDKPYKALEQLHKDKTACAIISALLANLLDDSQPLPENAHEWTDIYALEEVVRHLPSFNSSITTDSIERNADILEASSRPEGQRSS